MATNRPRVWSALAASTRKRYLSKGKALGQTPQQVRQHYESGGTMSAYRGHAQHPGASERQWAAMMRLAKASELGSEQDPPVSPDVILDSLLQKGFKPAWILERLDEKRESRNTYRSPPARFLRRTDPRSDAGYNPGRRRYYARNTYADIELFYYH